MKKFLPLIISILMLISLNIPLTADTNKIIDTDQDGLPDDWEVKYMNGDLTKMDKDSDYDNDGISNGVEYQLGYDPTTPDTRGSRISYQYDALGRLIKIERVPGK